MKLPRPLPVCDVNSDRYPDDDYYIEQWKITILNRIDRIWPCERILYTHMEEGRIVGYEYCDMPEHDPFTNLCWDHTPGNLTSGHM